MSTIWRAAKTATLIGVEPAAQSSFNKHRFLLRVILLAIAAALALGMVGYQQVLIALRTKQFQVAGAGPANWSDLYPRWLGARELLVHGRNPYNSDVTREIQSGFYGRPIDRTNPKDPKDPQAFAYPVYVVFLLWPLVHLSFEAVSLWFKIFLVLTTAASLLLWTRALGCRLQTSTALVALLAALSSYPVLDGLHLQQLTMIVAVLIAAAMAALARKQLAVAGVLLALATIKPQLVVLVIGFLLMWTASSWRSRKNFAIAFAGMMAVLLVGAEMVLPGWFGFWRQQLHAYVGYVAPPLLQTLLGKTVGITMEAFALGCGAMQFLRSRKEPAGSAQFNYSCIAALSITVLLYPNAANAKYNQVLLIPVALWLLTAGWTLAKRGGLVRITWLVAVNVLLWQWIFASAVSCAAFVLHHRFQTEASWFVLAPELLVFLFPLAIAIFVLTSLVPVSPLRPS